MKKRSNLPNPMADGTFAKVIEMWGNKQEHRRCELLNINVRNMKNLPSDISRCSNKTCVLDCKRKEPEAVMSWTPYADFGFAIREEKCEYQI